MILKMSSLRLSLTIAAGLAVATVSTHAQSATATISWVAAGSSYDYTITLQNTGTVALNSFWYGWTIDGDNLPSAPSSAGNSAGWGNEVSGNSIMWANSSYSYDGYTYYYGTSLAPGASTTFTFVSSDSPPAITALPSGQSVAYVGAIDFSEGVAGDSTPVFSPTLADPPPPVPTVTSGIYGVPAGASYDYTITLTNTGSLALNSFWYGWTTSGDNLASTPTSAGNSLGWGNEVSGNSIMWVNTSGAALAPGASTTFTFVSSSSPSAITAPPSGESVAYVGGIDFSEDTPGDSTAAFSPSLVPPPPAVPTVTASIYGVASGSSYDYTITLTNTGTLALNSFWYGWTTSGDNLASNPTNAGNSLGWGNELSGNSIMWINASGTALAPGASTTFTFVSSSSPSAITASPSGESVAYVGGIDFSEGTAGDSSAAFSPTLVSPPPAVPTVTATIYGVASGSSYDYTITLQNTGTLALNSFWYGWTTSGDNLASNPTNAGNSLGWGNELSGNSIMWINTSGTALAPGASTTFTFVSSSSPSAITASPSGESVAYVGGIDFSEGTAGDSSAVFSPSLVSPPASVPTVTASIYGVASGSSYDYTITLQNTGTAALNSFWYGWTTGGDNLPSTPISAANSLGWGNQLDAGSIMWANSSGTALAPGASATFTFVSSSSPSAITTPPSGESVAYVGGIDFSQGTAGDSTAAFSPSLVSPPPAPVLAVSLNPAGSGAVASNSIILAWPTNIAGLTLQSTTNLLAPTVWTPVSLAPVVVNGQNTVTNIISGPQQFFRLASP
jgi:hypothetical protein